MTLLFVQVPYPRDHNILYYGKGLVGMLTKKVNLIFQTLEDFHACKDALYDLRVEIIKTQHDYYNSVFTYYMEATREQAYELLDLANEHNGLLTKGEA